MSLTIHMQSAAFWLKVNVDMTTFAAEEQSWMTRMAQGKMYIQPEKRKGKTTRTIGLEVKDLDDEKTHCLGLRPNAFLHHSGRQRCKNLKSATVMPRSDSGQRPEDSLSEIKHDFKCRPLARSFLQWRSVSLSETRRRKIVNRRGLPLTHNLQQRKF